MPLIGMLSDSHGQAAITHRAVQALVRAQARLLLHLGDIGSIAVIDAMAVEGVESRLVFGNTDYDRASLGRYARGLGLAVDDPVGRLDLPEHRQLVYTHGHDSRVLIQAVADGVAYLCHGHTHQKLNTRRGRTRVINPGALCRAAEYTVALLDTDRDTLAFYPIDKQG